MIVVTCAIQMFKKNVTERIAAALCMGRVTVESGNLLNHGRKVGSGSSRAAVMFYLEALCMYRVVVVLWRENMLAVLGRTGQNCSQLNGCWRNASLAC